MSPAPRSDVVPLPMTCTLQESDGRERVERWRSLWARARPTARREDGQIVVAFVARPGIREELETLAAAERRCCAFARWDVVEGPEHVILRITSGADGLAAISAMLGGVST